MEMGGHAMKEATGFISTHTSGARDYVSGIAKDYMDLKQKDYDNLHYGKRNIASTEISFDSKGNVVRGKEVNNMETMYGSGKSKTNLLKNQAGDALKSLKWSALLGGGLYGLSAWISDDSRMDTSDRMVNGVKHGAAFAADLASDTVLTGVAMGLSTLGPYGMVAGAALNAFNIVGGFMGVDAGSMVMRGMDYADEQYESAKRGPQFNMTKNTSMALQRQLQNMHASGSNLGEMMHN